MSKNIKRSETFLRFFLNSTNKQQATIIQILTNDQILALAEIVKNLLQLSVSKKTKSILARKVRVANKLADSKTSLKERNRILRKYHKHWIKLFMSVKDNLLTLL